MHSRTEQMIVGNLGNFSNYMNKSRREQKKILTDKNSDGDNALSYSLLHNRFDITNYLLNQRN